MSKRAQQKANSAERRIVIVGGSREVLDDDFKDFIVEWLVPALVEEYLRTHSNRPIQRDLVESMGQSSNVGVSILLGGDHAVK